MVLSRGGGARPPISEESEGPGTRAPGVAERTVLEVSLEGLMRELLEEGTAVTVDVTGSSMTPFIRSGDTITLRPTPASAARLGDTLAVLRPGRRLRVHRLIGRGPTLRTRGDAAPESDPPVSGHDVLARVEHVARGGRRVRLGLGPERRALALFSRWGVLYPALRLHGWLERWRRGT